MTAAALPYALERPTPTLVVESLVRYTDDEEATLLFARACHRAGLDPQQVDATTKELMRVVDALEQLGDLAAVCAKGLRVRIMTYDVLSREGARLAAS